MSRSKSNLTAGFPIYPSAGVGGVSFPEFPSLNESPAQQTPNAPMHLGDKIIDRFGFSYVYVRAHAALAVGQVVRHAANTAGTVSANTTTSLIKTNITTTIDEAQIGSFITVNGAGGAASTVLTKLIKTQVIQAGGNKIGVNTNFYVAINDTRFGRGGLDGDVLGFTPTTGDVAHIVRPYSVDVCGVNEHPVGVALGTVTSGYRTLVQVSGLALILMVGGTDALVDNVIAVTAAAGVVKGPTGAGLTALEAATMVGVAKGAQATTARIGPVLLMNLENRL